MYKLMTVCAFALVACGCGSSNESGSSAVQSSSSSASENLALDQQRAQAALQASGVTAAPGGNGISCSAGGAGANPSQIFQGLQTEIQAIETDVQNQNTANLTTDIQNLQQSLMTDLTNLCANIESCLQQVGGGAGVGTTSGGSTVGSGIPNGAGGLGGLANLFQGIFGANP